MTEADARVIAHGLLAKAFAPKGSDEPAVIFCGAHTNGPVYHTPLCGAVVAFIIAESQSREAAEKEKEAEAAVAEARVAALREAAAVIKNIEYAASDGGSGYCPECVHYDGQEPAHDKDCRLGEFLAAIPVKVTS